eukprot:313652-Rhodomonas_salina.1
MSPGPGTARVTSGHRQHACCRQCYLQHVGRSPPDPIAHPNPAPTCPSRPSGTGRAHARRGCTAHGTWAFSAELDSSFAPNGDPGRLNRSEQGRYCRLLCGAWSSREERHVAPAAEPPTARPQSPLGPDQPRHLLSSGQPGTPTCYVSAGHHVARASKIAAYLPPPMATAFPQVLRSQERPCCIPVVSFLRELAPPLNIFYRSLKTGE